MSRSTDQINDYQCWRVIANLKEPTLYSGNKFIMLFVFLRFMDSDCAFDIFKLFLKNSVPVVFDLKKVKNFIGRRFEIKKQEQIFFFGFFVFVIATCKDKYIDDGNHVI